jgi:hypothetical protein
MRRVLPVLEVGKNFQRIAYRERACGIHIILSWMNGARMLIGF